MHAMTALCDSTPLYNIPRMAEKAQAKPATSHKPKRQANSAPTVHASIHSIQSLRPPEATGSGV